MISKNGGLFFISYYMTKVTGGYQVMCPVTRYQDVHCNLKHCIFVLFFSFRFYTTQLIAVKIFIYNFMTFFLSVHSDIQSS